MPRCKNCGRILKDDKSIERGYGPICQGKRRIGQYQLELRYNPAIDRRLSMKEQHAAVKRILDIK